MTSTRWWRLLAGTAAGLLVLVALLLTALRIAIAYVPQNEKKLRTWIERQTHMKLEYSRLDTRLRWYGPEVVLRDLRVLDEDRSQTMFATREGTVGLDLWNFLRTGQFVAGRISILEPRVTVVRLADGRIRLLGLRERPADRPPFDLDRLPAGRVIIDDAVVVYRDLKTGRAPVEFTNLDVQLRRDRDFVVMEGNATLPQMLGTRAEFSVRLKGSLDAREHLDARVEVDADMLRLAGLKDFLPPQVALPTSGAGPVRAVLALRQGRVSNLRCGFELRDVVLQLPARSVPTIEAVRVTAPRLELAAGTRMSYPTVTKRDRPARAAAAARRSTLRRVRRRRPPAPGERRVGVPCRRPAHPVRRRGAIWRHQRLGTLERQAGLAFCVRTQRRRPRPCARLAPGAGVRASFVRPLRWTRPHRTGAVTAGADLA